jgi:hypothetical protein
MRPYLVFVRAGKSSLHPSWLAEDRHRNWDCCVNAWGDQVPEPPGAEAEWHETGGLNKFRGFMEIYPRVLAQHAHRHVLMLDDDLEFAPGAISEFFRICEAEQLNLCQPAIRLGSHTNHVLNLHNPLCRVRRVNFVEVMAPCFDRATVERLIHTFSLTQCTWGIDWAWTSILGPQARLAVVDAITMHHTKPMEVTGGPFYERLRSMGIDPHQELAAVHERYPIVDPMHTLRDGHRYRWPLPRALNAALVAQFERRKLQLHLKRGGTYAQQTAVAKPHRAPEPAALKPGVAPLQP